MKWTAQQKIRLGFWLLAFVPILLGSMAARNAYELAESAQQLATTNDLARRLEELFSSIKDIEVAQREYILMGGDSARQTIGKTLAELETDVSTLREMGADPVWVAQLETLIPQKFEEIEKTVELRDKMGPEAASRALLANQGQQAMDDIRTVVRNMTSHQENRLRERSQVQERRFFITLQLFTVVLLVNVALIAILYFLQRHETERARQANEELERRVASRTEALQRSNEDLQQFAYVASHDIKEPMRMISSYTTLLQRRYAGRLDEDADTFIGYIVDGVKRMDALIQDLLEYSRAGGKGDQLSRVDVDAVLRNVMANLNIAATEAGASVHWEGLPKVVPYDESRLCQVFQNLIGNAIKYRGDRKPVIRINAKQEKDEIVFSVSDNGIGIQSEYFDKIFGIFQRLHGKEYEGTGIGLAMVKKIVERYGGRIWAQSKPGVGSTFFFTVPRNASIPELEALSTTTS